MLAFVSRPLWGRIEKHPNKNQDVGVENVDLGQGDVDSIEYGGETDSEEELNHETSQMAETSHSIEDAITNGPPRDVEIVDKGNKGSRQSSGSSSCKKHA